MPTLHFLGTGAAVSDAHRTTTMLAVEANGAILAIDCGGDLVQRLLAAQLDLSALAGLVITHEHPDHVSGFPLFMEKIWLAGRAHPLPLYGIPAALAQAQRCMAAFNTADWDLPEMQWQTVAHAEGAVLLDDERWRITVAPGVHSVPVVGLRIMFKQHGGVVAYSCDTAPSAAITRLAAGAEVLVHEATGAGPNHSSVQQAAQCAAEAGVQKLYLVHLPPALPEADLAAARALFPNTFVAEEMGRLTL